MPLLSSIGYIHRANSAYHRTPDDWATDTLQNAGGTESYCMEPSDASIHYRVRSIANTQIQRSTDSGVTFANFGVAMPGAANTINGRTLLRLRSGALLVIRATGLGLGVRVMRSTDDGATWVTITVHALTDDDGWGLSESVTTPNIIFVTSRRQQGPNRYILHRSTDDGQTWTVVIDEQINDRAIIGGVFCSTNGNYLISTNQIGTGGHRIRRSVNDGATWVIVAALIGEVDIASLLVARGIQVLFVEVGPGHSSNVGRFIYNGRQFSDNNGATWATLPSTAYGIQGAQGAAQTQGSILFPPTDVGIMRRSTNGGASWANGTLSGRIEEMDSRLSGPLSSGKAKKMGGSGLGLFIPPPS